MQFRPGDWKQADLLTTLCARRSVRTFAPDPVPAGLVSRIIGRGFEDDCGTWPDEQTHTSLQADVVAMRVGGLPQGMFSFSSQTFSYTPVAPLPDPETLYDMTIQREFCDSAVIISIAADLDGALEAHGPHGYRLLLGRASAAAYSMWLEAVSHGLAGGVFAGLIQASIREPLCNDGASRHPIFALALGVPPYAGDEVDSAHTGESIQEK
ncbi:nitroreductase family protein [Streptomyces sp. NBC_01077]|nr:nitroreductase family protein [Streptomyces sp. NBC_01077]WSV43655.1 nitroreductase family protein [Streptomyces sp. NBC_01077]